ncbi:hypothetical protein [Tautonia plasticadhaerens]|uniref:DUF4259 domain-containing protein n=1 Tax=Tautonia plasticadhaerens TaxID=2527974 RepID=A0A518GW25_9BACT|nr:hypothetical protein [Tautonia plasticadhaerens]QDV32800.1 hypothetical protein ElP_06400 [Tautonia plasticadhaerens]
MGHWGVRSYEVDEVADAIDSAFERIHGRAYDDLMSDRDPTPAEQIHRQLANADTLRVALEAFREEHGDDLDSWDELARLALCGVVVLHAELGVPVPGDLRDRAASWLEHEDLDWDPQPMRDARRRREVEFLRSPPSPDAP